MSPTVQNELIKAAEGFLRELDTNGGTLGGYHMQTQRKLLENAIREAKKEVHRAAQQERIPVPGH